MNRRILLPVTSTTTFVHTVEGADSSSTPPDCGSTPDAPHIVEDMISPFTYVSGRYLRNVFSGSGVALEWMMNRLPDDRLLERVMKRQIQPINSEPNTRECDLMLFFGEA